MESTKKKWYENLASGTKITHKGFGLVTFSPKHDDIVCELLRVMTYDGKFMYVSGEDCLANDCFINFDYIVRESKSSQIFNGTPSSLTSNTVISRGLADYGDHSFNNNSWGTYSSATT